MTIKASPADKQAAKIGRDIDELLQLHEELAPKVREHNPKFKKVRYDIIKELRKLTTRNDQTPYQRFLYQQLLRANAYGYDLNINDHPPQPSQLSVKVEEDSSSSKFADVSRVKVQNSCSTKDLYIYSDDRQAHGDDFAAFCKEQDPQGEKNTVELFVKYYHGANIAIGSATQKSNVCCRGNHAGMLFSDAATGRTHGQRRNDYHKFNEDLHASWLKLYLEGTKMIEQGEDLDDEHCAALGLDGKSNPYYALPEFTYALPEETAAATLAPQLTHVGHASALLRMGGFSFVSDPIHYQSGTDPLIRAAASLLYPRETAPAFATTRYPGGQIVWISHNHHDHLCPRTLKEAFPKDTIFIVPKGDKAKLVEFGFTEANVHELTSWNKQAVVTSKSSDATHSGTKESLTIRAIPAKHASNRRTNDYMESLFMGCIVTHNDGRGVSTRHLITGDTGTWKQEHYDQLAAWIKENGPIHSASLASGPDRPRDKMECTHQSSADAVVLNARISVANWASDKQNPAEQAAEDAAVSSSQYDQFVASACQGFAYHQGCYRLGLLSYADVTGTMTRMLAFLDNCDQTKTAAELLAALDGTETKGALEGSFYWQIMDQFERDGVKNLLQVYAAVKFTDEQHPEITVADVIDITKKRFTVPKIGATSAMENKSPAINFELDYDNLMVNKPAQIRLAQIHVAKRFPEPQNLYEQLEQWRQVFRTRSFSMDKKRRFEAKLEDATFMAAAQAIPISQSDRKPEDLPHILRLLGELTTAVQGEATHDNDLREEGNFQTMVLMLADEHRVACKPAPAHEATRTLTSDERKVLLALDSLTQRYGTLNEINGTTVMYRPEKHAAVSVAIAMINKHGLDHDLTRLAMDSMEKTVNQRQLTGLQPKDFVGLDAGKVGFEWLAEDVEKLLKRIVAAAREILGKIERKIKRKP